MQCWPKLQDSGRTKSRPVAEGSSAISSTTRTDEMQDVQADSARLIYIYLFLDKNMLRSDTFLASRRCFLLSITQSSLARFCCWWLYFNLQLEIIMPQIFRLQRSCFIVVFIVFFFLVVIFLKKKKTLVFFCVKLLNYFISAILKYHIKWLKLIKLLNLNPKEY